MNVSFEYNVMMMKKKMNIVVMVMIVMMVMMGCLVFREALHTSPSIIDPSTQQFFPGTQTISHTHTYTNNVSSKLVL